MGNYADADKTGRRSNAPSGPGLRNRRAHRRLLTDRAAAVLVRSGGLFVIICVLAIILVILVQVVPLFRGAHAAKMAGAARPADTTGIPLAVGSDDHLQYAYLISQSSIDVVPLTASGTPASFAPPETIRHAFSAGGSRGGAYLLGADGGRAVEASLVFFADYGSSGRIIRPEVSFKEPVTIDPAGSPVKMIAFAPGEQNSTAAAVTGERRVRLRTVKRAKALIGPGTMRTAEVDADVPAQGVITTIRLNDSGDLLFVGTSKGEIFSADLRRQPLIFSESGATQTAVTVLGLLAGGQTLVSGDAQGRVRSWMIKRGRAEEPVRLLAHFDFKAHRGAAMLFSASSRNKTFATGDASGELNVHYGTSGATLLAIDTGPRLAALSFSPKADAIIAANEEGLVTAWQYTNPHPEVSPASLFGKIWYEGRERPEYVWQSSAASDEVEPKLSLVPLLFGTIKGTLYALLFAVPISVLSALYVSQFMHPRLRGYLKPLVELMAALPSVVVGFLAGLWLAPYLEKILVGLFLSPLILAFFVLLSLIGWQLLPRRITSYLRPGTEVLLLFFVVLAGLYFSFRLGSQAESYFFEGGFLSFLRESLGFTYDQRNSLVVALAVGFAVIPLIFTITEDSLSSVPHSLVAASLALGATKWQTAIRIVLPSASPAIFSAVMIGFGRAVGETMIVLMATGNTPILDWSPFNGFRALSANIAVEMPEAAVGSSLYRVLFLTAFLLFVMTFVVNMLSEAVRLRLRRRYQQG